VNGAPRPAAALAPAAPPIAPSAPTPQNGREVAALAEALYVRLFVVALGGMQIVCAMAVVAALARTYNADLLRTTLLAASLAAIATVVLTDHERWYGAARRHPALALTGPVLALAALVIDGVSHSPLSYPAAVSIAVPAFVCGRRWALAAAVLISIGALSGAWVQEGASALNSVGQGTAGYFVWAIVLAGLAEFFAPLAMRMPQPDTTPVVPPGPLRVPNLAGDPLPTGVTPAVAADPAERAAAEPAPDGGTRLTARQLQVVALLADGLSAEEIAAQLSVATSTVYRSVERAKARTGVRSRSELVAFAIRAGLLRPGAQGDAP
jgi:DNA-binding CsgD family transcriptional regulator